MAATETSTTCNADVVLDALKKLGAGGTDLFTSREVMWEVRRAGYQMTTARARGICRVLCRQGKAEMYFDGRYFFRVKP